MRTGVAGAAGIPVMKTISRTNKPDLTVSFACQNIHTYIHTCIYIYIIVNFILIIMVVMGTSKHRTSKPSLDPTLFPPVALRLSYITITGTICEEMMIRYQVPQW